MQAPEIKIIDNPHMIFDTVLRIIFLRHGNAVKPSEGMLDNDRPLTDIGFGQAEAIGYKIMNSGPADLVLSSPATRARLTLMRALSIEPELVIDEETLSTAPPGIDAKIIGAEFEKLGHAPLSAYISGPATVPLFRAGHAAASRILELTAAVKPHGRLPVVVVGGHGVLLPAVALALAHALDGTPAARIIREAAVETALGEAEALEVTLFRQGMDGNVAHLTP